MPRASSPLCVPGQESARARAQGCEDLLVLLGGAEDQDVDCQGVRVGDDPPCELHPVDVGQRCIEQKHVGVDLSGQGDGLRAVGGGPDDCDVRLGVEQRTEPCASELVRIGDQDADLTLLCEVFHAADYCSRGTVAPYPSARNHPPEDPMPVGRASPTRSPGHLPPAR